MKKYQMIKLLATMGVIVGMLVSMLANAAYKVDSMPAIQNGFPASMADWMNNPQNYAWNPLNVRLGAHPDRSSGVVYIFPDATTANAWWDPLANPNAMPATIPDDAVAYIHWKMDNNSGKFPGIMTISDDKNFKTNNCIMSSGDNIPVDVNSNGLYDDNVFQAKTCSNPRGSSKRFKLVVLKADAPIDLVFNTTSTVFNNDDAIHTTGDLTELVYDNYEDPPLPGDDPVTDDIFRMYRYIMKFGNGTATDSASEVRDGTRLIGIKLELGYGLGPNPGDFTPTITDDPNTPLVNESEGLEYDLRLCIADRYFDEKSAQTNPGMSDCDPGWTELWLENEFAVFSPSMYSTIIDKRQPGVGGYWDKNPAGIYAPQIQTAHLLDSGSGNYVPNSRYPSPPEPFVAYDPFDPAGQIGQVTSSYFDVASSQGAGAGVSFPNNMFGYLMYYGVLANGDSGNISSGIYRDDDGYSETEGGLYAWWDGTSPNCCYRWGIDRDFDGVPGPDAWEIVSDAHLAWMASRPMDNNNFQGTQRYSIGYMDDMASLNSDTFIKITPAYKVADHPAFTVRFTAQSVDDAINKGWINPATDPGILDGPWIANGPMGFGQFPDVTPVDPDAPDAPTLTTPSSDSGGWCSYNPGGRFDPVLPGLLLAGIAYLGWRLKQG
ncbi:MAG: choice-of-anchor F family protein [Gammaproteobacteria bacterium]